MMDQWTLEVKFGDSLGKRPASPQDRMPLSMLARLSAITTVLLRLPSTRRPGNAN